MPGNPLTREQREQVQQLAAKATPGPWSVAGLQFGCAYVLGPDGEMVADGQAPDGAVIRMRGIGAKLPIADNAAYIAAASPDVLQAYEALLLSREGELAALQEQSRYELARDHKAIRVWKARAERRAGEVTRLEHVLRGVNISCALAIAGGVEKFTIRQIQESTATVLAVPPVPTAGEGT